MKVIYNILTTLQTDDWYGVNYSIEIAKGKYKLKTLKEKMKQIKRNYFFYLRK